MTSLTQRLDRRTANIIAAALLAVAVAAYTWATWQYFTRPVPGGNDFLARYTAFTAYFKLGLNPYSDAATLYTQQAVYGRAARPGEDLQRLTYPFYSVMVFGPFILFDYAVARAIFMTLLQAAVVVGVALTLNVLRWRPTLGGLALVVAWALLDYPQSRGVILGQVAILGFLSLAGALWLLARGRNAAAGMALVLATVKPTLVFLVVPYLLLWAIARRRWRFVAGFVGLLAALCAASFAALPSWLGDFAARVAQYPGYTVGQSPVWVLTHEWVPRLGVPGEWTLTALCLGWLLWAWWLALARRPESRAEFFWALGVTLVVSNLIVPRSATTNYVLQLVPILWVFALLDGHGRAGRWLMAGVMAVALVGQWWLHLATVVGNQEQSILFFPWPVALGLALLFGRRWLVPAAEARDRRLDATGAALPLP
ncbi:MAG: DUF2029 domain-containing protein [Anaerolineales bacterium]|nr:DUF2029 domain-containing protein [Anaerolineales bacterium]